LVVGAGFAIAFRRKLLDAIVDIPRFADRASPASR